MRSDKSEAMIGSLILVISLPFGAVWSGYVLSILWGWFIVPTFEAPTLTVVPAIGLAMVVGYLTKQETAAKDERDAAERIAGALSSMFVYPLFALIFGWVLHFFM